MTEWIPAIANGGGLMLLAMVLYFAGRFAGPLAKQVVASWTRTNEAVAGAITGLAGEIKQLRIDHERHDADVRVRLEHVRVACPLAPEGRCPIAEAAFARGDQDPPSARKRPTHGGE